MAKKELGLTFGVDIQCILAFHESYLQMYLDEIGDTSSIIKTMTEEQRAKLYGGQAFDLRKQYMGWALTSEVPYSMDRPPLKQDLYADCHREFGFRPYADEISHIAQTLLPGPPKVYNPRTQGSITEFSTWQVSDNPSLFGADKNTIKSKVGERFIDEISWDTHGIVLISPRTLAPNMTGFYEIADYLSELVPSAPSSRHSAFTTQGCGLHVHVGHPIPDDGPPQTFTLPTLQHLTYIMVIYELEIGRMHTTHRRANRTMGVISESRREEMAVHERQQLTLRAQNRASRLMTCGMPGAPESAHQMYEEQRNVIAFNQEMQASFREQQMLARGLINRSFRCESRAVSDDTISYAETRKQIFALDMTVVKLNQYLARDTIVNFNSLTAEAVAGIPHTIEFRQREGTLDMEAIKWWVLFVVGLVQLAHRMANELGNAPEYAGEGYPHFNEAETEGGKTGTDLGQRPAKLEQLWALMDFQAEGRTFYKRVMAASYW